MLERLEFGRHFVVGIFAYGGDADFLVGRRLRDFGVVQNFFVEFFAETQAGIDNLDVLAGREPRQYSKRGGLCKLAEFTTSQVVVLISGVFLSLKEVASFGLMQQLFVVSHTVAITAMVTFQPQMAYWLAKGQNETMRRKMAWGMQIFYVIFIVASLVIIFAGQPILRWIGSNSMLPATEIICVFAVLRLFESNYLDLCQVFVMSNRYPFVRDVLLTGIGIMVLAYLLTAVIPLGVWGLVLAMGICQLSWNDWYWARRALGEMQISSLGFLKLGFMELRATVSHFLTGCTR